MKVERIKILAEDLGLQDTINELVDVSQRINGEYALTKKGKAKHKEEYTPRRIELQKEVSARLEIVLPEYKGCNWSFGRLRDYVCYVTIFNKDWE